MKGLHTYAGRSFTWQVKAIKSIPSAVLRTPESWAGAIKMHIGKDGKIDPASKDIVPPEVVSYDEAYVSSYKRLILKNPKLRSATSQAGACKSHSWVNTGMTWTYCKHCEVQAKFAYGSIEILDRR
jgi:hypothetical protein